eukprot:jgi/Mesen1/543/ME001041S10743
MFAMSRSAVALALLVTLSCFLGTDAENPAITRFRNYLKIDTVHPDPDYTPPAEFLLEQGKEIGLKVASVELVKKKPTLLLTWEGSDPSLPSIQLNSHMDVVPAEADKWMHDPFGGEKSSDGNIYARGSQDMKSVGMQYLEAIRTLKAGGHAPLRTVHVTFVPDEEIGGQAGAAALVNSPLYARLNPAILLDEGLASPGPAYRVFNGERALWWLVVTAMGAPGHGSKMYDGSAIERIHGCLNKVARFRAAQLELVKSGRAAEGDVTSVNPVFLRAGTPTPTGYVMNLQPSEASAGFDIRLPPTADVAELERLLREEWAPPSLNMSYEVRSEIKM